MRHDLVMYGCYRIDNKQLLTWIIQLFTNKSLHEYGHQIGICLHQNVILLLNNTFLTRDHFILSVSFTESTMNNNNGNNKCTKKVELC